MEIGCDQCALFLTHHFPLAALGSAA